MQETGCLADFASLHSLSLFSCSEPTYVIGLYPNLLPEEYRKQLEYPSKPATLSEGDLEKGFHALTSYLTRVTILVLLK